MKLYRADHLGTHGGVESLYQPASVKRELIAQRRTRKVYMHHSALHIPAHGVSVYPRPHDFGPKVGGTVLTLRILEACAAQSLGHYIAYQSGVCLLHEGSAVRVKRPSVTSHRR